MNADQRDALIQKVRDLLGEHCVSFAVIMECELDDNEASEDQTTVLQHTWSGTFTNARGLVERFRTTLEHQDRMCQRPEEDDDEGDDWRARKS